jgi:hypothetical protein
VFYSVVRWFSLRYPYQAAAFEIWILEIFWKINLGQAFGTLKNNLD